MGERFTASRVPAPGIAELFHTHHRWQRWLDVEAALAQPQAEFGIIPPDAAQAISAACRIGRLDTARIEEGIARQSHPPMPLTVELSRSVGEPHDGWVHWGATTQNITQTGDVLVLRQAHRIILRQLARSISRRLGLSAMPVPSRSSADHFAEFVCALGLLAGTCEKLGRELYTPMKTVYGEVEEPVPAGTSGSSTMPQKRNPQLCQDILGLTTEIRALVPLALETMHNEHEADHAPAALFDAQAAEGSFADLLASDSRVTAHLAPQAIKTLLQPSSHTGHSAALARTAAAQARDVASHTRTHLESHSRVTMNPA
ncbi:lyase family protein [Streptomyces noursei]|uniref:lyase family protein n=1 Tax=Streptomyces noursei TaxID=1971 RepID=UPI001675E92A|nr:lyase family protein [Streptomyces noursei]MCZ1014140.1 lyase family protein [Streptomyces noursei]GGX24158.1 hypothetical protein GCM10010341_51710 [Streptomyces noursei]